MIRKLSASPGRIELLGERSEQARCGERTCLSVVVVLDGQHRREVKIGGNE